MPGHPERIPGELAFASDGGALTLAVDHGSCAMTTGTMVGPPYALSRTTGAAPVTGWLPIADLAVVMP